MPTLKDIVVKDDMDAYLSFDMTEIDVILSSLKNTTACDIATSEFLQQQSLRCADIIAELLSQIVYVYSNLESELSFVKNKTSFDFKPSDDKKNTADMRKYAGESHSNIPQLTQKISAAKAARDLCQRKYELLIKAHHHYKEISTSMRKTIISNNTVNDLSNWSFTGE